MASVLEKLQTFTSSLVSLAYVVPHVYSCSHLFYQIIHTQEPSTNQPLQQRKIVETPQLDPQTCQDFINKGCLDILVEAIIIVDNFNPTNSQDWSVLETLLPGMLEDQWKTCAQASQEEIIQKLQNHLDNLAKKERTLLKKANQKNRIQTNQPSGLWKSALIGCLSFPLALSQTTEQAPSTFAQQYSHYQSRSHNPSWINMLNKCQNNCFANPESCEALKSLTPKEQMLQIREYAPDDFLAALGRCPTRMQSECTKKMINYSCNSWVSRRFSLDATLIWEKDNYTALAWLVKEIKKDVQYCNERHASSSRNTHLTSSTTTAGNVATHTTCPPSTKGFPLETVLSALFSGFALPLVPQVIRCCINKMKQIKKEKKQKEEEQKQQSENANYEHIAYVSDGIVITNGNDVSSSQNTSLQENQSSQENQTQLPPPRINDIPLPSPPDTTFFTIHRIASFRDLPSYLRNNIPTHLPTDVSSVV